jgi:hypothetical protein
VVGAHPKIEVAQQLDTYERLGLIDVGDHDRDTDELKRTANPHRAYADLGVVAAAMGAAVDLIEPQPADIDASLPGLVAANR